MLGQTLNAVKLKHALMQVCIEEIKLKIQRLEVCNIPLHMVIDNFI